MMDKFRAQRCVLDSSLVVIARDAIPAMPWLTLSERFGTNIITETIARVDFSQRPFKYWTEGEEEEADFMTADT
jgi:hypothetical protein